MKNSVKIFGIIALVAVIGFGFTACGDDNGNGELQPGDTGRHGDFSWSYGGGFGMIIIGYYGPGGNVEIPGTIRGAPVGAIDGFADSNITSVTIPPGVIHISWEAFENNQLTSVTIPDSVTTIEGNAFANNNLTSITIGANVTISQGFPPTVWAFGNNGFEDAYIAANRQAGTWTRPDTTSTVWTRQ